MKKHFLPPWTISIFILFLSHAGVSQDQGWPKQFTNTGATLTCYQPQVESWENYSALDFRMAFSLRQDESRESVGVAYFNATTDVNTATHQVLVHDMKVLGIHFPDVHPDSAAKLETMVRTFFPVEKTIAISLDRIVACVPKKAPASTAKVNNDPPVIFVSYGPAIMLQVDGEPVYASIDKTRLKFLVNTNWPVFYEAADSSYYLYSNQVWLTTPSLSSPWSRVIKLPSDFTRLKNDTSWAGLKSAIPPPNVTGVKVPEVYYSSAPSELIIFDGSPQFEQIRGTTLQYATNTSSDVFLKLPEKMYYCLFSGRWFRTTEIHNPWDFATELLPADFANIPHDCPAARVLSSVPGTEDAQDAVMIAQIPTTVTVNPASADSFAHVAYNGSPVFLPIEGTTVLYAANTPEKVILADDQYYLCLQGLWFVSVSPVGPWKTARSVPATIYTIPPSCPAYNVTFVTQYATTDGLVTASYTAGYMGVYVVGAGTGMVLAMGTGFYYPPCFIYPAMGFPAYYPAAMTYGYVAYGYHPYCGVQFRASYDAGGTYARSATTYGPYGRTTTGRAYNPYTGTYARGGSVSTPDGTRSAAQAYNPRTGASAETRQGSSPYGQWGSSVVSNGHGGSAVTGHASTASGSVAGGSTSAGGKGIAGSGVNGSGAVIKTSGGDLYADRDGTVYKNTDRSWQKANNSFGSPATAEHSELDQTAARSPDPSSARQDGGDEFRDMDQEARNRQRGDFQSDQFQRSGGWSGGNREASGGFGSGGGFGGGRRR